MSALSEMVAKRSLVWILAIGLVFTFITSAQAAQVTLAWDANDPTPDGYRLYQRTESGTYNYDTPTWSGSGTTCILDNLADETTYYYVVRAYSGSDESGDSNEVSFRSDSSHVEIPIQQSQMSIVSVDSEELEGENGAAINAIDGQANTIWHTQWMNSSPNPPHQIIIDLGGQHSVHGFRYLPRQDGDVNGTIARYSFYVSQDGMNWGTSVAEGEFAHDQTEKQILFEPKEGRFILFEELSEINGNPWASVAELNILGDASTTVPEIHTITASAGAYGQISPAGASTVTEGESQSYTVSAFAGYHIADVVVDGASVGAVSTYTFNAVGADHTISASFAVNTYSISASAGANGTVSPSGSTSVAYGESRTYTFSPSTGYHVSDVLVDGVSVGAVSSYTFNAVSSNHTISASFTANQYTISASAGANGTVSPSGSTSMAYGESQTYTVTASSGYHVSDVLVDGVSVGAVGSYTFNAVSGNHTISAGFAANTYTISATSGQGGTIDPSGQLSIDGGASQSFAISADSGYEVEAVMVDGQNMGVMSNYTFDQVSSNHTISVLFTEINQLPVADAGPDQNVDEAQVVTLSASNSMDPDDGIVAFSWRQIQGSTVELGDATSVETTFTAPDVDVEGQALVFELVVADNSGATAKDTCIVNVSWVNEAPTAQAGADQSVMEGVQVVLDAGNSVDPDNGIATYQWRQTQGPTVMLSDSAAVRPTFTAPEVDMQGASIQFELTVTDDGGLQDTDQCIVTISWSNEPPVADAGPDQQVMEGQEVYLNGSNSIDADDGIATYQWRQTNGSPVVLSDSTAVQPTFFAPDVAAEGVAITFQLTVTDNGGLQHNDTCTVNISWENEAPVASAGADQTVSEGETVQLDAGASTDADDGIGTYQWNQISGPTVNLSDPQSVMPTFNTPDVGPEGASMVFQLTVIDYSGLQSQDECIVNITWQNMPPVADAGIDLQATSGDEVTLDGSDSSDGDDGIDSYRWRQIGGTPVTIQDTGAAATTFTAPEVTTDTTFEFELTVTDNGGLQSVDHCSVVVHSSAGPVLDTAAPEVSITDPDYGFVFVRKSKITLRGVSSDNKAVVRVVWENDRGGSGQATGTTSWEIVDLKLSRWFNTITVTAYDAAGNHQSTTLKVFAGIWR